MRRCRTASAIRASSRMDATAIASQAAASACQPRSRQVCATSSGVVPPSDLRGARQTRERLQHRGHRSEPLVGPDPVAARAVLRFESKHPVAGIRVTQARELPERRAGLPLRPCRSDPANARAPEGALRSGDCAAAAPSRSGRRPELRRRAPIPVPMLPRPCQAAHRRSLPLPSRDRGPARPGNDSERHSSGSTPDARASLRHPPSRTVRRARRRRSASDRNPPPPGAFPQAGPRERGPARGARGASRRSFRDHPRHRVPSDSRGIPTPSSRARWGDATVHRGTRAPPAASAHRDSPPRPEAAGVRRRAGRRSGNDSRAAAARRAPHR